MTKGFRTDEGETETSILPFYLAINPLQLGRKQHIERSHFWILQTSEETSPLGACLPPLERDALSCALAKVTPIGMPGRESSFSARQKESTSGLTPERTFKMESHRGSEDLEGIESVRGMCCTIQAVGNRPKVISFPWRAAVYP